MPTYSYACPDCGHAFDIRQSFSDDALTVCPECGATTLRKVIHPVGIAFKGSGFYKTRAASGSNGANGSGGANGSDGSGEKKEPAAATSSTTSESSTSSTSSSSSSGGSSGGSSASPVASSTSA